MLELLGPLASLLGIEAEAIRDRLRRQAVVWAPIGAFGLVAAIFLLVALDSALAEIVGPVIAALIIAATALAIVLAVYLIGHLRDTADARLAARKQHSAEVTALLTTAVIAAVPLIVKSPLLRRIGVPAGGVLAAAYALSRSRAAHRQ